MDCKPESAARTLCRIALLVIQGALLGICRFVFGVVFIPGTFCLVLNYEVRSHAGWSVIVLFPVFLIIALVCAIAAPFIVGWKHCRDICEVVAIEWRARWLAASPKKPDGEPIPEEELVPQEE